jgi:hypothetical protein
VVVGYLVTIRCDLLNLCTPDTLHSNHFAIYLAPVLANSQANSITCMYFFLLRGPQVRTSDEARRQTRDTDSCDAARRACEVRVARVEL